jgi:TetR/AcrR family transcriptional regulator, cholesterol catabolism regulator
MARPSPTTVGGHAATTRDARETWRSGAPSRELTPILSNALDVFFEVGYHGTTVREIAKRTGQTVPTLYYYHENKEAILFSLLDDSISNVIERCELALAEAGDDALKRFEYLIECLVLYMVQHSKRAAMDAEIRSLGPENRKRYIAKRKVVEQMVGSAIKAGIRAEIFRVDAVRDTTRAILGMIWAITVWYRPAGKKSAAAIAATYVEITLHTVGYQFP